MQGDSDRLILVLTLPSGQFEVVIQEENTQGIFVLIFGSWCELAPL